MLYAVVPLAGDDPKLPDGLKSHVSIMNEQYAPRAWFVAFNGTTDELTDLIWPEQVDEGDHPMPLGMVIRMDRYNGFASTQLWEWLGVHHHER